MKLDKILVEFDPQICTDCSVGEADNVCFKNNLCTLYDLKAKLKQWAIGRVPKENKAPHCEDGQDCGCVHLEDSTPCEIAKEASSLCIEQTIQNITNS